jgi:hypothetical protein
VVLDCRIVKVISFMEVYDLIEKVLQNNYVQVDGFVENLVPWHDLQAARGHPSGAKHLWSVVFILLLEV